MDLYEKNGNILYVLNVLKEFSDENHMLQATEIQKKIKEKYNVDIDPRTIKRNINLLKYKFEYDISTRDENKKGYYITRNPDTDFEAGEIRAIIDTFSYSDYIEPQIGKSIIQKCKNLQNIYENAKLKDYQIFAVDNKTDNMEVIKNIEDISEAIHNLSKIQFEYWKYDISNKLTKNIVSRPKVAPYAIIYNEQQFYLIGIKEGNTDFYYYRLDRIKNIKELDEKRTVKKTSKEVQNFAESTVGMFSGEKEEIEAKCRMFLLDAVFDQFGKNIILEKIDNEYFKMTLNTSTKGFKMWAMRMIDCVEVVKPESLRNEMRKIAEDAMKRYV